MYVRQIVRRLSWCCSAVALVFSVTSCGPTGANNEMQFGSISLSVTKEDGSPYPGLIVRVAGKALEATTDAHGGVRFEGLPAGEKVSLAYAQPFQVQDHEHGMVASEMLLEDAVSVTVPKGEAQLTAKVKAGIQAGAGCNTTPWAFMGITIGSDLAPFVAKGSVGKHGPCSCRGSATAPLGAPPCPGTTVFGAGSPPAPQAWSVTSDTCLGEALNCEGPVRSFTSTIFK